MIKIEKKEMLGSTFIDLFAGIGGFHLALDSLGSECLYASEWDKSAAKVYHNNFNIMPDGDITKVSELDIPKHDILCGGFPCQAFSISGKQKGFEDTRGTLFYEILRIVAYHKPKIVFLENVKNLIKHNNGETFVIIENSLIGLGYDVNWQIINTSHFGLPQNRERVYIIGFRKDLNVKNFKFPSPINTSVKLSDVLEENPIDAKVINRLDVEFYKNYIPQLQLFDSSSSINKPIQIGKVNKGGQGERIYHPEGHAITLSANGGGVGSKTGLYYINNQIRKLTPRECARLQGFPESFIIDESKSNAYKQFGNSVSVNVLQNILIEIVKSLKKHEQFSTSGVSNG
ncbi:DNA (cytosine-5-)-methyltransferase [Siphonobacter sp. BAB-5405]|uniref:DNA cytosine methyltransferase n=1 Tax=Siphonobacter sp. BAB-5405 TaxID=1864825 RepID=UPI000C7FA1C6|nr:DNA cytosine methyltransferase [Siphonobacter sp. BAB-5405]PMD96971.1 DNA (cytosine-5-)-methyltransferase [Siphonobacter sp. BAB-5405]